MKAENPDFNYQSSAFRVSSVGRRGGLRFASTAGVVGDIAKTSFRAYKNTINPTRENDRTVFYSDYTFGKFFEESLATVTEKFNAGGNSGVESFNDIDARNTYADRHDRQHKYIPTRWFDVAAGATSTVFSPFAIDRAASYESGLQSIRLVSGEVSRFDQRSIISFAERSVGGIEGVGANNPNLVT
jgi:hypothetical protein